MSFHDKNVHYIYVYCDACAGAESVRLFERMDDSPFTPQATEALPPGWVSIWWVEGAPAVKVGPQHIGPECAAKVRAVREPPR